MKKLIVLLLCSIVPVAALEIDPNSFDLDALAKQIDNDPELNRELTALKDTPLDQPCRYGEDDSGYTLHITSKLTVPIKFRIYYVVAEGNTQGEYTIDPGTTFKVNSCRLRNRLGLASTLAISFAEQVISQGVNKGIVKLKKSGTTKESREQKEVLENGLTKFYLRKGGKSTSDDKSIPEELAALATQAIGYPPVCFKKIEFDYVRSVGDNPFAIIKEPITKTTTYQHMFGLNGSGIACNDINIEIYDSNSALSVRGDVSQWTKQWDK